MQPSLRERISDQIERLLAMLDELDGDPDVEGTALERHGVGFVATGHDDDEDSGEDIDISDQPQLDEGY